MPKLVIDFQVDDREEMLPPDRMLAEGGRYLMEMRDGDLYVWGNTDGLTYLAEVFARLAVGGYAGTVHLHLPFDSRDIPPPVGRTAGPGELIVFAATEQL